MGRINVLDKAVAELIAAGEVVERPASIVKELVENAIDAGAKTVTVEIAGGGIRMIRVADDGSGIEREDIPKAFLRHATSKVSTADDLDSILTLGFRGEALASIAAVCRVELTTKTAGDSEAVSYRMEGGAFVGQEPAARPTGTTITVRDVFFNTPARMKFLKRDVGEGNAVAQVVDKCAMSHPEVAFRFIRDGQVKLRTSGSGGLPAVIRAIYGAELAGAMLPVDYLLDGAIRVTGYAAEPGASRPSRAYQNFFINGRYVRTRTCSAALEEAYKNKLMAGRFPACVLNLEVLAQTVDVNVHPAKIEVRFADEKPVFSAVYYAVKSALAERERALTAPPAPKEPERSRTGKVNELTLHLPQEPYKQQRLTVREFRSLFGAPEPVEEPAGGRAVRLNAPSLDIYVEDEKRVPEPPAAPNSAHPADSDKIGQGGGGIILQDRAAITEESPTTIMGDQAEKEAVAGEPGQPYRLVGELFGTYILLEQEDALLLVDKHAAHERMMYEQLLENIAYGNRQVLLRPVPVVLAREEYDAVLERLDEVERLGFGVEDFGGGTLMVREAPIELGGLDAAELLGEIAAKLLRGSRDLTPASLDRLYYSIACKSAVRAGDKNSPAELDAIVRRLEQNPQITHCPHGRPVSVRVSRHQVEKMFGRIV